MTLPLPTLTARPLLTDGSTDGAPDDPGHGRYGAPGPPEDDERAAGGGHLHGAREVCSANGERDIARVRQHPGSVVGELITTSVGGNLSFQGRECHNRVCSPWNRIDAPRFDSSKLGGVLPPRYHMGLMAVIQTSAIAVDRKMHLAGFASPPCSVCCPCR